ncbi:hypothetical protein Prede_0231 [Prevotella dentalis DSM 3688]|uniref:Uncharacterized protein n=1 Tax=Prevotella dentalis (strain ATCC 49559 / DSM 3688 / JCM 13448 / NCTC 12043 / ES 2772) TaxID=908937 RepID=F9D124_PREDD|nr:hypothetical protein [Prevotella dentalis]AGB27614.1 hypothetical protein Prede_0231 [Prevotella dentalis DSM 3688]EGQ16703.1 hypothetical protein HMPREF9136_0552 [Prevotella dentalis DSM 3688]
MTALEMKSSLLQTISEIDDAELIRKISAYVNRSMGMLGRSGISRKDLVVDPEVMSAVIGVKGGPDLNEQEAYRRYIVEKYQ